jgi:hypothetical protein
MVDESGVERCEGEDGRTRKGRARNLVVGERESQTAGAWQRAMAGRLTPPASNMTLVLVWLWNWSILVHVGESARAERVNLLKLPSCLPTIQDNTHTHTHTLLPLADSSIAIIAQPTNLSILVCSNVHQSG